MVDPLKLSAAHVLASLDDEPANVEARGLLIERPDAVVIGHDAASGVVFAPQHGMGIGFGSPAIDLWEPLREVADRAGMRDEHIELHLPPGCAEAWCALPGATRRLTHFLQVMPGGLKTKAIRAMMRDLVGHEVALLDRRSDDLFETLPKALGAEFQAMEPWPVVVASLAGGAIGSIASSFVETEAWFDVSIDTVPDFRRMGFGLSCAAELVRHQAKRGKRPVWMVKETNRASQALSAKLGFETVGHKVGVCVT